MYASDQVIRVLDDLCSRFGIVIDWASENVIPYVHTLCAKLVSYEIWTSVAWLMIMLVVSIVMLILVAKYKTGVKDIISDDVVGPLVFILLLCLGGAMIGTIISQIMDIIKCVTFPEMYIFEYIHNLIESNH